MGFEFTEYNRYFLKSSEVQVRKILSKDGINGNLWDKVKEIAIEKDLDPDENIAMRKAHKICFENYIKNNESNIKKDLHGIEPHMEDIAESKGISLKEAIEESFLNFIEL